MRRLAVSRLWPRKRLRFIGLVQNLLDVFVLRVRDIDGDTDRDLTRFDSSQQTSFTTCQQSEYRP